MKNINLFLDLFLPRFCIACNSKLQATVNFICESCYNSMRLTDIQMLENEYYKKFLADKYIIDFTAAFVFEKDTAIQHVLHTLKYKENFRLGIFLGSKVGQILFDKIKQWNVDYIIPVPLHHLKKAERGYNQSFYLSKGISLIHKINVKNNILRRTRFTKSQTELNKQERKENVMNAFEVNKIDLIKNKNLILVDDVITTGATINECARLLKENGAKDIFALSFAVA